MAVATRRPGFTPWIAWVGAGALGAGLAAWASQPGSDVFGDAGGSYWVPIVLAAPLALLQFLVLRGLMGFSAVHAGIWVGVTLVAAAASVFAISEWYFVAPQLLPRIFGIERGTDVLFTFGDYLNPLLLGLAQGVVLAWVLGRRRIAAWWVVISVLAYAGAIHLALFAITASGFDTGAGLGLVYVLWRVAIAALYAALTGLALIAILRMPAPPARTAMVRTDADPATG